MFQRFIFFLLLSASLPIQAQTYRYLILFKDKAANTFTVNNPSTFLSSKSLERRRKNRISINTQDLPVSQTYLNQVKPRALTYFFH